jgi:hypothetical protein
MMRVELITVSGVLTPGPGGPDQAPRQDDEYVTELNSNALTVSEHIEREVRHFLPPGSLVSAGITFRRGSIEFELLIWIMDFTGNILAKMGAAKMLIAAIDPIVARSVNKVVSGLPLITQRVRAITQTWEDESARNRVVRVLIGFGWFLAGLVVALTALYLRRGG